MDPPHGRASNPADQHSGVSSSAAGPESFFSRAVRKKCSGSDWGTFIKLFMSLRESCLVAAASPFASVIFGSGLGLCSSLVQKWIYKYGGALPVCEKLHVFERHWHFNIINCWNTSTECLVPCICWLCITEGSKLADQQPRKQIHVQG